MGQETDGESLTNQDRAFQKALDRNSDWVRIRHYREAASAKTVAGRAEFSRMLHEIHDTNPDWVVVDTIDRFTRNLREGLNLLEAMRGRHIRLMVLDWRRDRPIDLDDDRDWQDVVSEFVAAERENRIRSRRIKRSYEGRRERGAVMRNRPPFGLIRQGDNWVPGPHAWVVKEVDRQIIAGVSIKDAHRWARAVCDTAWETPNGVGLAMRRGDHYVAAGVRSPETAAAIAEMMRLRSQRFGTMRKYEHEFAGVFACGRCVKAGILEEDALMLAEMRTEKNRDGTPRVSAAVDCYGSTRNIMDVGRRHDKAFIVRVSRLQPVWHLILDHLESASTGAIERWAHSGADPDVDAKRRALLRRLAEVDDAAARLRLRRDRGFDLLNDPELAGQARQLLRDVGNDEAALTIQADALRADLHALEVAATPRSADALRHQLERYREYYDRADLRDRNLLNRQLCAFIGSYPRVDRDSDYARGRVVVTWPAISEAGFCLDMESGSTRRRRNKRGIVVGR